LDLTSPPLEDPAFLKRGRGRGISDFRMDINEPHKFEERGFIDMKKEYPRNRLLYLVIICIFAFFHSCGQPDEETTGGGSTVSSTASSISLALSQVSVKSDDSDSSTITATVLDANNVPMEAVTVTFSTTGGVLSASSADTNSSGQCATIFSSGPDSSNQTVTITATVTGIARQVPVQISGSTLTLITDSSNLEIGGNDTATLTITAKDAGSITIYDTAVTVSVDPSSTGNATLALSAGYTAYTTDISGVLKVDVTGTGAGSVTVRVTGAGVTATQIYTVGATGAVFGITSPTQDPYSLSTGSNLTINVNAPSVSNVGFATTIGAWDGGTDGVVTKAVAGGTVSATLRSTVAGVATVQVYDSADISTSDSLTVAISAPSSEASKIALQASATVVARSEGSTTNSVTLEATVTNTTDQIVGSAPISFLIINPTGGGETISPVIISTDDFGVATTTFTSGSVSSDAAGVTIVARVVGSALAGPSTSLSFAANTITRSDGGSFVNDGFVNGDVIKVIGSTSNDGTYTVQTVAAATLTLAEALTAETAGETIVIGTIVDSIPIVIGGTAGSIMIGQGTTIKSINDETAYEVPMSVLVADSNGNPMSGIQVFLQIWPSRYATGAWDPPVAGKCAPVPTGVPFPNEDTNKNLTLDTGEDTNLDGQLTPPNSAAGSVPEDVTTDENGVANFKLVYLKSSAAWIEVELTATTGRVVGSETQSTSTFGLGYPNTNETCLLPDSPFCHPTTNPCP
jgi:hypothetical protein